MNQSIKNIVEANIDNQYQISRFLRHNQLVYRHLDWLDSIDWLGKQPYLLSISDRDIQAVICAASEIEFASWIRLFGVRDDLQLVEFWNCLLNKSIKYLQTMKYQHLMALATQHWFAKLLETSGFVNLQTIIILEWKSELQINTQFSGEMKIRPMQYYDLEEIRTLDKNAFSYEWQISLNELHKALNHKGHNTVAVHRDNVVGYLISTISPYNAHLARLAVNPQFQRRGIASGLLSDFLTQIKNNQIKQVTVNTQADNKPSIKLYQRFGFQRTSQTIPVWELNIENLHKDSVIGKL